MKLESILNVLQGIAPLEYAESWDNVGLLVGSRTQDISQAMTCLTLTKTTLDEAIANQCQLIVCHHPIPFKPLAKITSDTSTGELLLKAIQAGIAIYSPHTAWDNAKNGINQQLADILCLQSATPLQNFTLFAHKEDGVGVGRQGVFAGRNQGSIQDVIDLLKAKIPGIEARATESFDHMVRRIGIVCGSGGSMLGLVASRGCDAMLTGEATYHQCLDAQSRGIALIMIGHHASESFAMATLASMMQAKLPEMSIVASQLECSRF